MTHLSQSAFLVRSSTPNAATSSTTSASLATVILHQAASESASPTSSFGNAFAPAARLLTAVQTASTCARPSASSATPLSSSREKSVDGPPARPCTS